MVYYYLVFIPLFGAFMGWLTTHVMVNLIFKQLLIQKQGQIKAELLKFLDRELGNSNPLADHIKNLDLETEVAPILDERLDRLIESLKNLLPIPIMGNLLISPSMRRRLKETARNEILGALPLIKEKFAQRVQGEFDLKALIAKRIQSFDFNQLAAEWLRDSQVDLMKLKGLGALVGLGLSLVELLILLTLHFWGK